MALGRRCVRHSVLQEANRSARLCRVELLFAATSRVINRARNMQAKNKRNPSCRVDLAAIGAMFRLGRTPPSVAPHRRAGQTLRPSFIQALRRRSRSIIAGDPRSSRNPRGILFVWIRASRRDPSVCRHDMRSDSDGAVRSNPPRVGNASNRSSLRVVVHSHPTTHRGVGRFGCRCCEEREE